MPVVGRLSTFMSAMLGFVLGCALQLQQSRLWALKIYVLIVLLALIFACWIAISLIVNRSSEGVAWNAGRLLSSALPMALCAAAIGFGQAGLRACLFDAQALDARWEGLDIRVTGVIAAMPQRDESGVRFRMDVEAAHWLGSDGPQALSLPPRIHLAWYRSLPRLSEEAASVPFAELHEGAPMIRAGERWQMLVRLKAPHGNINPHGFDFELWLWEQGVQATGYVRATPRERAQGAGPLKIGNTSQRPLEALRQTVRDQILSRVTDPQRAGVVAALAVGDQAAIERSDWDVFRATGVAHLMSISGLHITLFAWGAAWLTGALWRRSMRLTLLWPAQYAAQWGGCALAASYALFAGWGVPAQRTIFMLVCATVLSWRAKNWSWPAVWLFVLTAVVAIDPWALLSAGFWLSFFAVGILFASAAGAQRQTKQDAKPAPQILRMLREQWVISVALAPMSLLLFNQVSLVGLLANAAAIPWVTLVVTPLALLGMVADVFWDGAAWAAGVLGRFLQYLAESPYALFSVASGPEWIRAGALVGGLMMIMRWPWALRAAGLAMVSLLLLWKPERPAPGEFSLLAADIGQGNAVLVTTAHHALLYDAGPRFSRESDAGQRTLVPLLRALGIPLDVLLVSHRDADHIGGAAAVLRMQQDARLISSIEASHELQDLRQVQRCKAGQRWNWDGVDFEILHPQAEDYAQDLKPNAMSCVLRISNARSAALLTGDLEAAQESRLVQSGVALKADLLLVPHHGSKSSSSAVFLDAVQPQIAWVQAGYRNRFQHPVPEVMARYEERGVKWVQSSHCGAASWASQQPKVVLCERQRAARYWHHRLP
jgi:competence protein ComEC